jgi:hypothetical protein
MDILELRSVVHSMVQGSEVLEGIVRQERPQPAQLLLRQEPLTIPGRFRVHGEPGLPIANPDDALRWAAPVARAEQRVDFLGTADQDITSQLLFDPVEYSVRVVARVEGHPGAENACFAGMSFEDQTARPRAVTGLQVPLRRETDKGIRVIQQSSDFG